MPDPENASLSVHTWIRGRPSGVVSSPLEISKIILGVFIKKTARIVLERVAIRQTQGPVAIP